MIQTEHKIDRRNIDLAAERKIRRRSAELAVVGAMAFRPEAAEIAMSELSGNEISYLDVLVQFRAIARMTERGVPVDAVTLAEELIRSGQFEAAGGGAGIAEVLESVPHAEHARFYVEILQKLHQRDCLRSLSERLTRLADDDDFELSESIPTILNELETIRAGSVALSGLITAGEALEASDSRNDDPAKIITTGLNELDRQLWGGLRPGQLVVVGGRPGLGKSALMMQIILNAARTHRPGLIASLEMTAGEIAERGLKTISRQRFAELPVLFSECGEFSKLVSLIRLAKRRDSIELAAVDYLQLIDSPIGKNELRSSQIGTMSKALKRLAMELQIPILLGSQLNRESEKRGRPSLADLRESGAIEQDADIVILLSGDAETDERELIVAKHRGGPCGIVRATFDRPKFWFCSPETFTGNL